MFSSLLLAAIVVCSVHSWSTPKTPSSFGVNEMSRQDMLKTVMGGALAGVLVSQPMPAFADTTASGVSYEVIKSGDGPKPDIGELAAIRFRAFTGSNKYVEHKRIAFVRHLSLFWTSSNHLSPLIPLSSSMQNYLKIQN